MPLRSRLCKSLNILFRSGRGRSGSVWDEVRIKLDGMYDGVQYCNVSNCMVSFKSGADAQRHARLCHDQVKLTDYGQWIMQSHSIQFNFRQNQLILVDLFASSNSKMEVFVDLSMILPGFWTNTKGSLVILPQGQRSRVLSIVKVFSR